MENWLSVKEITDKTGIPEQSLRRYLKFHAHHLRTKKQHKSWMIAEESIVTIQQIRSCYEQGMNSEKVEETLAAMGRPIYVEVEDEQDLPMRVEIGEELQAMKQMMGALAAEIMSLRQQVASTQDLLEQREQAIVQSIPQLPDPTEERERRINDWITQKRVETKLEQEALELWMKKPEGERMKKVGLFRKEEDRDRREQFVKVYIAEHYEDWLKKEYGLLDKKDS